MKESKRSMPTPSVFLGRCRNAFTLVELLCVIAILALLANLIFPSLQNARNKALSIACSSNMRQIGVAVLLAAGDNDGRYPMIEGEPNGPNSTYPPGSGAVSLLTALQPYGVVTNTVKCPSDMELGAKSSFVTYGTSYQWRPYLDNELTGAPNLYFGTNVIPVSSARVALMTDFTALHRGRMNRLYGDGHVKFY